MRSLAIGVLIATLACSSEKSEPTTAAPEIKTPVTFACEDKSEVAVEFIGGASSSARVTAGASTWTLPLVPAASGARYSDGKVTFWNKGDEALFERNGQSTRCAVATASTGRAAQSPPAALTTAVEAHAKQDGGRSSCIREMPKR